MIEKRPFAALGGADHGWLKARHHFSFANYYDPKNMGWGALRVWNDDEIQPQSGFPPHPHSDMEIITYVREGAITHQDSMGNKGRTGPGDVQVMSAGQGVRHAEYNLENDQTTLFQIWIEPTTRGGDPYWGMKPFPKDDRSGKFVPLASGYEQDKDSALPIRAEARVGEERVADARLLFHLFEPPAVRGEGPSAFDAWARETFDRLISPAADAPPGDIRA